MTMTRVLCSATLTLLLFGCAAEEPSATAPAPPPAATTSETAAVPAASAAPASVPADYDVTGAYFPMDALPAEFAELEHLLLATIDENAAPAPLNGFLRPKARTAEDYRLVNPSLEGRKLTFTTTTHKGVHYAFDGQFELLGKFAENPPDYETVVLTGTLKRLRDGQTVASTPVRFRYEAGG
jgi:hypothetical protein